jgi:hypothetical protein
MSDIPWTEKSSPFFPSETLPHFAVDPTGISFAAWSLIEENLRISFIVFGPSKKRFREVLNLRSERFKNFGLDASKLQHVLIGLFAGSLFVFLVDHRTVVGIHLGEKHLAWSFLGKQGFTSTSSCSLEDLRWRVYRTIITHFSLPRAVDNGLWAQFIRGESDSFSAVWDGKVEVFFRDGEIATASTELSSEYQPLLGVSRLGVPAEPGMLRAMVPDALRVVEDAWGNSWAATPSRLRRLPYWPSGSSRLQELSRASTKVLTNPRSEAKTQNFGLTRGIPVSLFQNQLEKMKTSIAAEIDDYILAQMSWGQDEPKKSS